MNWHAVEAPKDTRCSLSVFTTGSLHLLSESHWEDLALLKFPVSRLRQMHQPRRKEIAGVHLESKIMEGLLAMIEQQPLEAGSHVDEKDPWLAFPELYQEVFDTVSGQTLPPELVAVARKEEM
eukprot:1354605-Amphidinium_carterae.1